MLYLVQFRDIPRGLERGMSVSENAESRRRWIVRFHIGGKENETFLIRVWKPFLSRLVLKQ